MTESRPFEAAQRAASARALMAALRCGDAAAVAVLQEVLDKLELGVAVKDVATGRYTDASPRMAVLFGSTAARMVGAGDADLLDTNQIAALRTADQVALGQPLGTVGDQRIEIGGARRDFSVIRVPVPIEGGGAPRTLLSVWQDVTATRQREAQLQQALAQLEQHQAAAEVLRRESQDAAVRDAATGLYQRTQFEDQLRREVDLSLREHREFALVSIAVDPLGGAALAGGPAAHLRVLEALGRLLRSNTRAMDASCRLGDDRFAVLLSGVGLATAHSRMEGLRRQCATQIVVLEGQDLGFTVSMGVASFPHTAHTQEALMQAADSALGEAQRRGGNHVTLASIRFELS